ncbi:MAG: cupin domain-containing protein [Defluviicoccus sp.]|nr:MAG: cupin domain-containing protein [Defluviicoccus sp.]
MERLEPDAIIAELGLAAHPEGGWYRETFRDAPPDGSRGALTQIYYLLRAGERSRWHRVDAAEVWHFYAGDPLCLQVAEPSEPGRSTGVRSFILGLDFARGQQAHAVVPVGVWQAAEPLGRFTLIGCTVAPAFRFEGFELAPDGWQP